MVSLPVLIPKMTPIIDMLAMPVYYTFTCAVSPVMAASSSRLNLSILFVRLLLGVITWTALYSANGIANADQSKLQPRTAYKYKNGLCLRLDKESKIVGDILPVEIRVMLSDAESLSLRECSVSSVLSAARQLHSLPKSSVTKSFSDIPGASHREGPTEGSL